MKNKNTNKVNLNKIKFRKVCNTRKETFIKINKSKMNYNQKMKALSIGYISMQKKS